MPLVIVKYTPYIPERVIDKFVKELPAIVALALNVHGNPEARLSPADIEVWVNRAGSLDVNEKNLEIVIFANLYPERLKNLDERQEAIRIKAKEILATLLGRTNNVSGYVWVLLQPGSFGEL